MKRKAVIRIRRDEDELAAIAAMGRRFSEAWKSGKAQDPVAVLSFSSPAQLFSVITPKRWELIEQLQKSGPSSQRGLARALERDIKRVHEDIAALMDWGIIETDASGRVFVPYDEIEADFTLSAVA